MEKSILRTTPDNQDFRSLVAALDVELREFDGDDHTFYSQFNKLDKIQHCVVCYIKGEAVACGALRKFDAQTVEIKRMYTKASARGKGAASLILTELERWATELGFSSAILETGINQAAAIRLYPGCGYSKMENYGPYAGVESSICMKKMLR